MDVILVNLGRAPFTVKRGERIAQLIRAPLSRAVFVERSALGTRQP